MILVFFLIHLASSSSSALTIVKEKKKRGRLYGLGTLVPVLLFYFFCLCYLLRLPDSSLRQFCLEGWIVRKSTRSTMESDFSSFFLLWFYIFCFEFIYIFIHLDVPKFLLLFLLILLGIKMMVMMMTWEIWKGRRSVAQAPLMSHYRPIMSTPMMIQCFKSTKLFYFFFLSDYVFIFTSMFLSSLLCNVGIRLLSWNFPCH